jgi:hypothetical protein
MKHRIAAIISLHLSQMIYTGQDGNWQHERILCIMLSFRSLLGHASEFIENLFAVFD